MTKDIMSMSDAEFKAHHKAGMKQIQSFGNKLNAYKKDVDSVVDRLAKIDDMIASFK